MTSNRGIDDEPGWVNRKLRELQDQITALRSERRAAATTVGSGGFTVDGGDVVMRDTDGSLMFLLGTQENGDRGFLLARDDASVALAVRKSFAGPGAQTLEMRDRLGYQIVSEEPLGSGLSHPFLHIPLQPVAAVATTLQHGPWGVEVPVASASFVTTHRAWFARHNQYGRFMLQIAASDTTTSAEVQFVDVATGNPLFDFFQPPWLGTRAVGSTAYTQIDPPRLVLPGNPDDRISIAVQVRRTAGVGTLRVAVPESHGS